MNGKHVRRLLVAASAGLLCLAASAADSFPADQAQGAANAGSAPLGDGPPSFAITDDERAWLEKHPVIRVAATQDWPPFEYVDSEGAYKGIAADLLRLLSKRIGFETDPIPGDWTTLYEGLKAGELDLCPAMGITPEREQSLLFTKPLLDFPHAIYVREGEHDIACLDDLAGKTVAVERNYYTQEMLEKDHPDIQLSEVDSSLQALLTVSSGEVDAYLGNTAVSSYLIDQNVIMGVVPIWCMEAESLRLSIGVRKDFGPLVDMLNRAIAELTAAEKREVIGRYNVMPQWVDLTEAELDWIRAHPTIRLGVDPEFAPFEFLAEDGSYKGMASDYVRILNQRLGLSMEVAHKTSWGEAAELAMAHELDVLPCVGATEERLRHLLLSDPYLSFYRVIVTREDGPLAVGLRDLSGLRVAVQANTSHHGFLMEQSDVSPLLYDTAQKTLAAVSRGEADAAVGNVATASYWIRKLGLANLRVVAPVDENVNRLHFAVRNDWPELVAILNKGLAGVTEEEAQAIRKKWVGVTVESGLQLGRALRILGAVVAVAIAFLGLLALHNRRLRAEVRVRRRAEDALRRSEADYRTLVESANSAILRMSPDGTVLFVNAFAERFFGYASHEIVGRNVVGTIVPESEMRGRDLRELMANLGRHPEEYEANENENMTKAGDRVWMSWTNRPLYDAQGELKEILCVGADVTARRRAEEVLFRYEFIVNTVDDMMSVLNTDGRYEAVNSAWCSAMNMDRQAVVGRTLAEVWPEHVADGEIWPGLRTCFSGESVTYESVIDVPARGQRHCEVTIYPCANASGVITHAVVVTHDVTDWRTAQAALKEAKLSRRGGQPREERVPGQHVP